MKILSVVWFNVLPPHFGGQKGTALFNRNMSRLVPLACLCSSNNIPGDEPYEVINTLPSSRWQVINPFSWLTIYRTAKEQKASHLILEYPYHGLAAVLTKKLLHLKLVVHEHNMEAIRFKKLGKWWWRLLYQYEGWTLRQADTVFFKTEADRHYAVQAFGLQARKLMILPYGIETRAEVKKEEAKRLIQEKHQVPEQHHLILFAGTLDYQPNEEAVLRIHRQIAPLLNKKGPENFTILICGRNRFPEFQYLKELKTPNVVYVGEVEDIGLYFSAADVFINPVMEGGGVQTKSMDALSYHCNLVCMDHTLEGIPVDLCPGKIFTATRGNWEEFCEKIRQACGANLKTPEVFFEQLSWKNLAQMAFEKIKESEIT